jgi:hypothetical protein
MLQLEAVGVVLTAVFECGGDDNDDGGGSRGDSDVVPMTEEERGPDGGSQARW